MAIVVKPSRMWIDGLCFTILKHGDSSQSDDYRSKFDIKMLEGGLWTTSFRLPTLYYAKLLSQHLGNFKDLQTKTDTEINVPEYGEGGVLTVKGSDIQNVINARNGLHSIANQIREGSFPLQFISIPVLCNEINQNFEEFKRLVMSEDGIEGMHESIFINGRKLHLSVVMLTLLDKSEIAEAIDVLNSCKTDIFEPVIKETGPLKIRVSGIECMTENWKQMNVLFANAKFLDETRENSLQSVANKILQTFYERGLAKEQRDSVKLHVTLINTKYRKTGRYSRNRRRRQPFNATKIMTKYKSFHFGDCCFNSVQLSLITSVGEDGFYKPLSIVNI